MSGIGCPRQRRPENHPLKDQYQCRHYARFSPNEIKSIFIYGNGRRETLMKQLIKMLDDAEDDEVLSSLRGVIEKVNGMTNQAFSKISRDLIHDFDRDE